MIIVNIVPYPHFEQSCITKVGAWRDEVKKLFLALETGHVKKPTDYFLWGIDVTVKHS